MKAKFTLSQTIEGYIMAAEARRLSPTTIAGYQNAFHKFTAHLVGLDPIFATIQQRAVEEFLAAQVGVKKSTVHKYHVALSSLWTWAVEQRLATANIVHSIPAPRPEKRDIQPIPEQEIRAILNAIGKTRPYNRPGKRPTVHVLPDADRNRAIVLTLLDTGLRVSEICDLKIYDVELRNQDKRITVSDGKGSKERSVPISATTAQAIWYYLKSRPDARLNDPLFATDNNRKLRRDNIGNMLESVAHRAGVSTNPNPHRWRHTFAINYLRNGGDVYTLQAILGHESMQMCLRYLAIAQSDIDTAHRRASPVGNWRL